MRVLVAFACAAVAACASSGSAREAGAPASAAVEGRYDYIANLPGQQVRGTMLVLADTIIVEPQTEYCRPAVGAPDPLRIFYTCLGPGSFEQIRLSIDRRSPVQLSKWSATYRVQRQREICTQYVTRDGRQVCVATRPEFYETTESRSGSLQVRRIP